MSSVSIELKGWDKIVGKYGVKAAQQSVRGALEATTQYTADLVKLKLTSHTVTGFLRSHILADVTSATDGKAYASRGGSTVYYAPFVERGTGVYGPRGQRIYPVKAKRMAWHPKTPTGKPLKSGPGSGKIFRRSVKGQQPVAMFSRTYNQDQSKIKAKFLSTFRAGLGMK